MLLGPPFCQQEVSKQCDQKKSPKVCNGCLKMIDFNTFTKIA